MSATVIEPPDTHNTTLLVLCGGRGLRMGGQDKPLLPWRGKAMVDHVLNSVPRHMSRLISANRNLADYARRAPVVRDAEVVNSMAALEGPLVGVLAGLSSLDPGHQWLLICPGDTPDLPLDWWRVMFDTASGASSRREGSAASPAVVAHDGTRQQHLHLLLHRSLKANLREYLRSDGQAVHRWLSAINPVRATFTGEHSFRNFNRPEDFDGQGDSA